jgi:hypothetical protein
MFGNKKKEQKHEQEQADQAAVQAELERLQAMTIEQVAAEVMTRTFVPSGPFGGELRENAIADAFLPDAMRRQPSRLLKPRPGHEDEPYWKLKPLVREALQILEHKGLIVYEPKAGGLPGNFQATQLGTDAIAQDTVGRVIDGESL